MTGGADCHAKQPMVLCRQAPYRAISKPVTNGKDFRMQPQNWWLKLLCGLQRSNGSEIVVIIIERRNDQAIIIGCHFFPRTVQYSLSRTSIENSSEKYKGPP